MYTTKLGLGDIYITLVLLYHKLMYLTSSYIKVIMVHLSSKQIKYTKCRLIVYDS